MPILDDILQHRVLGREYERGRLEGALRIIRMQIERRFGPLPDWAEQSLRNMTVDELENLADRVFEVQSLELRARIPGFRPGHAPTSLVRRHFQGRHSQ